MTGQAPIDILLVEDNPGDIRLTQEALKEGKISNILHVATDGEQALDFLYKRGKHKDAPTPDIILLDLNLPRINGRQVLEQIKGHESLRRIPVVVLTTSTAEEDIVRSYDLHVNCYICKPVDMDQFIKVVKTIDEFWFSVVKLPKSHG